VDKERQWEAAVMVPFEKLRYQWGAFAGYDRQWLLLEREHDRYSDVPPDFQQNLGFGFAGLVFSNAKSYGFSVAPEEGRSLQAAREEASRAFGSDHNRSTTLVHWSEFRRVPFTRHHAFELSLGQGFSNEPVFPQEALSFADGFNRWDDHLQPSGKNPLPAGRFFDPLGPLVGLHTGTEVGTTFYDRKISQAEAIYHFPITYIERGPGTGLVFFDRVAGAFFYRVNQLWAERFDLQDYAAVAGTQVALTTGLAYTMVPTFVLEVSKRTDRSDDVHVSFSLQAGF